MGHRNERTFLVESYAPKLDERIAAVITSRFEAAARQLRKEGAHLRWLRSFALIDEETYLCIVAATDREHVVRLSELAGLEHDHVVEVLAMDAAQSAPS